MVNIMKKAAAVLTKQKKKKWGREEILFHTVMYIVFGCFTLLCAYPFYYLLICTISNSQMVDMGRVILYPVDIHFKNYIEIILIIYFFLMLLLICTFVCLSYSILLFTILFDYCWDNQFLYYFIIC